MELLYRGQFEGHPFNTIQRNPDEQNNLKLVRDGIYLVLTASLYFIKFEFVYVNSKISFKSLWLEQWSAAKVLQPIGYID